MARRNKWFETTFLPSLFEKKHSPGQSFLWLSEKQLEICESYMNTVQKTFNGRFTAHLSIMWEGREVKVYIVPCKGKRLGQMFFGRTDEEQVEYVEESNERAKDKRLDREKCRIEALKRRGDFKKLSERKQEIIEAIEDCKYSIEMIKQDIADGISVDFQKGELKAEEQELAFLLRRIELYEGV